MDIDDVFNRHLHNVIINDLSRTLIDGFVIASQSSDHHGAMCSKNSNILSWMERATVACYKFWQKYGGFIYAIIWFIR